MAKDIYKTFKRSISVVTGGMGDSSSSPSTSSSKGNYKGGSGRTWIHPPEYLINGRVEYVARFLGFVETSKPHGSDVAKEAIHAIRFQRDLKRSEQTRESAKLQKVDISISIDNVTISDNKTKQMMYKFHLGRISFCADDKDDKRMFSFIARAEGSNAKHSCFAFTSEKMAEEITLTIGEAFDLAYKRFLDKNRSTLKDQKEFLHMKKRIVELETENRLMKNQLNEAKQLLALHGVTFDCQLSTIPPALPTSPMPQGPPPNIPIYSTPKPNSSSFSVPLEIAPKLPPISTANGMVSTASSPSSTQASTSPSGPAPSFPAPRPPALVPPPPPPVAPRRQLTTSPKTSTTDNVKQLEGLNLGEGKRNNENVFDDLFDPRAGERKNDSFAKDLMSNNSQNELNSTKSENLPSTSSASQKTAADIQDMIDKVDKKLAEYQFDGEDDFEFGQLQTGELNGVDGENEYGTPSDRLNPEVMNLKK